MPDALRVEPVDRLVKQQHPGIAEQRGRDPESLSHPERERAAYLSSRGEASAAKPQLSRDYARGLG
jgi:hypothetical protein